MTIGPEEPLKSQRAPCATGPKGMMTAAIIDKPSLAGQPRDREGQRLVGLREPEMGERGDGSEQQSKLDA